MFIDESWVTTNMARRYGRAPRGQRVIGSVPHGHWMTSTFIAGLRCAQCREQPGGLGLRLGQVEQLRQPDP